MRYRTCDFGAAGEVPSRLERKNVSARAAAIPDRVYDDAPRAVGGPRPLVINLRSRKGGWNIISTKRLQTHADTCTH